MAKKHRNGHGTYGAYVFREKDPAIHELQGMAVKNFGHALEAKDLAQVKKDGGPSTAAMRNWFFGTTMRPQNCTIEAAGRAMGFQRVWQPLRKAR